MLRLLRDRRAVALLLAASLTILSNTIISPALPGIEDAFTDQSNAALIVPLLVTAPSLLVAIVAPFAGLLADRFGRRRQLLAGVLLFVVAGSAGLWLPSLTEILISRLVLGVAVALIMTAQTALVGDYFVGSTRARFMGVQIGATNLGGFVFVLLAGWLAGQSPFLPFVIYAVALLYLPLMWVALTEPERDQGDTEAHSDAAHAAERGWKTTLGVVIVLSVLSLMSFYLVPTQVPYYLVKIGHPEPAATSIVVATVTLSGGVFSLAYGRARARLGRGMTQTVGYAFLAAGFGLLALAHVLVLVLLAGLLLGAGTGFLFPSFLSIALDIAPALRRGLASGAVTTSIFLGQFLSPLAGRPLIAAVDYAGTFALAAGLFVVFAVVALLAFRERSIVPSGGTAVGGGTR